jgi:ferredoxin
MIVAEQKPIEEIFNFTKQFRKVLVLGCGTCVTVCSAGGEKEVATLAPALALKSEGEGLGQEFLQETIERQCDREFIEPVLEKARSCDAVLSMACGAGVQLLADMLGPSVRVLPALNTKFMGITSEQGLWTENCRGCGDCVLHLTGGICPVSRCSKSLSNGPCGGYDRNGKCEAGPEVDCGWLLIFNRLKEQGRLDDYKKIMEPKNWNAAAVGAPGRVVREDLKLVKDEDA